MQSHPYQGKENAQSTQTPMKILSCLSPLCLPQGSCHSQAHSALNLHQDLVTNLSYFDYHLPLEITIEIIKSNVQGNK